MRVINTWRGRAGIASAILVVLSIFGPARATDWCATTIAADVVLDQDLVCPGDGLIVGADDIDIDLHGHAITGSGVGVGIRMQGRRDVRVHGGLIRNFESGILAANSTNIVVIESQFTENREAIFLNGSVGCEVKENLIWNNSLRGVMVRPSSARQSTRNLIAENVLIENASGVLIFGQPLNVVRENLISRSARAALHLTGGGASGNLFSENHVTENAAGIEFGPGWVGNTFVENRIEANSCGTTGATDGNTFRENVFTANLVDECP